MKTSGSNIITLLFTGATLLTLTACNMSTQPAQPAAPPDTRTADETAIRAADAAWVSEGPAKKDAQKWLNYYADNAKVLVPGAPMADGKPAITAALNSLVAAPGFALTFTPTTVTVARGGDMAYEIGDYAMTLDNAKGKPETEKGKYVVVWAKQPDGSWKAVVDAPTTSQ